MMQKAGLTYQICSSADVILCDDLDAEWDKVQTYLGTLDLDIEHLSLHCQLMQRTSISPAQMYGLFLVIGDTLEKAVEVMYNFYCTYYSEIFYDIYAEIQESIVSIKQKISKLKEIIQGIVVVLPEFDHEVYTRKVIYELGCQCLSHIEKIDTLLNQITNINKYRSPAECLTVFNTYNNHYRSDESTRRKIFSNVNWLYEDIQEFISDEEEKRKSREEEAKNYKKAFKATEAGKIYLENKDNPEDMAYSLAQGRLGKRDKEEFFIQLGVIEQMRAKLGSKSGGLPHFPYVFSARQLKELFGFLTQTGFLSRKCKTTHFLYYFGADPMVPADLTKLVFTMNEAPKQMMRELLHLLYDEMIEKGEITLSCLERTVPNIFVTADGASLRLAKNKAVPSLFLDKLKEKLDDIRAISD